MKRILFIPGRLSPIDGSCWYRCITPSWYGRQKGLFDSMVSQKFDVNDFYFKPDAIVMQRQISDSGFLKWKIARSFGVKLVYELDDLFFQIPDFNPSAALFQKKERGMMARFARSADLITVTTQHLANHMKKYNDNIAVLPNSFETVNQVSHPDNNGEIRIGWAGTYTHEGDVRLIVKALAEVALRNDNVKLVFMGYLHPSIPELLPEDKYIYQPFVKEIKKYLPTLYELKINIGVVPVINHPFNLSKSAIKLHEYSLMGIASVISPVGEYLEEFRRGLPCLVAKKNKHSAWVHNLEMLIHDHKKRQEMGEAAEKYTHENFNVEKNIHLWADAYSSVLSKKHVYFKLPGDKHDKKVLIAAPLHRVKEYSIHEYIKCIFEQNYLKYDVLLVDNSETEEYSKKLQEQYPLIKVKHLQIDYTGPDVIHKRIADSMNMAREIFLEGDWDYLFILEVDILLGRDSLSKLIAADKDVIQGNSYAGFFDYKYWEIDDVILAPDNRGVHNAALIKRKVVEKIPFRYDINWLQGMPDAFFYLDLPQHGYKNWLHCGVKLEHMDKGKGERGWSELNLKRDKDGAFLKE